jgi:molecular chaperone GrpE
VADGPDITPDIDEASELESLRKAAEESKKKAAEYFDQLLRLRAEFENFRRRVDKEKSDSRVWGKQEVLMPLVGLVDVFEQALAQAHKAKDLKHVVEGVEMLHKSFAQFLKAEGLEAIEAVGKPFDPQVMEAMIQEEVDADQAGTVLGELQKGYLFNGRILRPSRVRVGVARKVENSKDEETETPDLKEE